MPAATHDNLHMCLRVIRRLLYDVYIFYTFMKENYASALMIDTKS